MAKAQSNDELLRKFMHAMDKSMPNESEGGSSNGEMSSEELKRLQEEAIEKRAKEYRRNYLEKLRQGTHVQENSAEFMKQMFTAEFYKVAGHTWNKQGKARETIEQLCYYFADDPRCKWNRDKGIFLYGGFGTGKTTIMKTMNRLTRTKKFLMKSTLDVAKAFAGDTSLGEVGGYAAIKRYTNTVKVQGQMRGWLFDYLGAINSERATLL